MSEAPTSMSHVTAHGSDKSVRLGLLLAALAAIPAKPAITAQIELGSGMAPGGGAIQLTVRSSMTPEPPHENLFMAGES